MLPVHAVPRYLLTESIANMMQFIQTRPFVGSVTVLGVYGGVLGILRWRFGKAGFDMALFAVIITALLIVLGSVCYTYTHVPGFRFGG